MLYNKHTSYLHIADLYVVERSFYADIVDIQDTEECAPSVGRPVSPC